MPNSGFKGSRASKGGRPTGAGGAKNNSFKPREDGRGGRSPQRAEITGGREKPRWSRDQRREAPAEQQRDSGRRESGRETGRETGRRDWAPREKSGRSRFESRERNFSDRSDRGERGSGRDRFERADRTERSERSEPPQRENFGRQRFDRDGDRRERTFADRADRGPRRDFDESRRPNRADRVERDASRDRTFADRRASNPNKKSFFEDVKLERLASENAENLVLAGSFGDMELNARLVSALAGMGAETPFPIQAATIPAAISGRDILGRGKTGSGKTIAFSVPLITKLVNAGSVPRKPNHPRALVLAPTRELADQIDRTMSQLARAVGFYTTCIYGGVPQRKQEFAMQRGVDIVVATPGRLEDLMAQGVIDLSLVETLVIDEADHMCDLGFIEGVRRIMRAAGDSQKLLFSATLDREVDALVHEFLPDPFVYEVPNEEQDTSNITHRVLVVDQEDRSQVLLRLVQGEGKSLIFTRTKMTAERLSESLTAAGVPAARLHGDLNQNQRNRNLERFTRGQVRVLVATDVAARGIHVDNVALVIQVDPPEEYKTYLHRAGRTGRAHHEGTVVTLIPRSRRRRMEQLLDRAERDGIFSDVRPSSPLLEELAGPIAPAPAAEVLDFGDSRGDRRGSGDRNSRGNGHSRGGDRDRGPRKFDRDSRGERGSSRDRNFDRPKRDGERSREDRPKREFAERAAGRSDRDFSDRKPRRRFD